MMLLKVLRHPNAVFRELAHPGSADVGPLLKLPLLLVAMPPLFAFIGSTMFGWRFVGAEGPLRMDFTSRVVVSLFYLLAVGFGFVSTVIIGSWMAASYGARSALPVHCAFFAVVSAPLALASLAHLYPNVFFNVLVLIPAVIWSMTLLYRGLPVVMDIPPERGMLMASALVGWLLVAVVSLLGITAGLWTLGFGPSVRI